MFVIWKAIQQERFVLLAPAAAPDQLRPPELCPRNLPARKERQYLVEVVQVPHTVVIERAEKRGDLSRIQRRLLVPQCLIHSLVHEARKLHRRHGHLQRKHGTRQIPRNRRRQVCVAFQDT